MNRRDLLKLIAAGVVVPAWVARAAGRGTGADHVLAYLETLRRPDHGYAWGDQADSHLTPTFGAIGCYHRLGRTPPDARALAAFVRTHHPEDLKKLEQPRRVYNFQQVQSLIWLGEDAHEFRAKIAAWTAPIAYMARYEKHGYPVLQCELGAVWCHALLGLPQTAMAPAFRRYVSERQRVNGSFNNTPAQDGSEGHVMNTYWGLTAAQVLGLPLAAQPDRLVAWLRACQRPNGGFTYQPSPAFAGNDDVAYTRAAVASLALLGATPADRSGCIDYLLSLANDDGGFGDRPGWASNASATFCALEALHALSALDALDTPPSAAAYQRRSVHRVPSPPPGLKVFSIQIESHGNGSPKDTVELARGLHIDLWGAKNATPEWMAAVQARADQTGVPVTFFTANEEYGNWVDVPGLGTYSHTADVIAPPRTDAEATSMAKAGVLSWEQFRDRRMAPLEAIGGRLIWQFGENEELVRLYFDDSLERGGYAAISTFHFGNPDFTNSEPFLNRWRGRIPSITLQDAHGPEPWWFADVTTGCRTLFLAEEPTYEAWMRALKNNWVVAVRHDSASRMKTWRHGGSDEVVATVFAREAEWRWWDNLNVARPLVSLAALRPGEKLEAGAPERGVALRVRCAWQTAAHGELLSPLAELVSLTVDGRAVATSVVEQRPKPGSSPIDRYHLYPWPDVTNGSHVAVATVREIATGRSSVQTVAF